MVQHCGDCFEGMTEVCMVMQQKYNCAHVRIIEKSQYMQVCDARIKHYALDLEGKEECSIVKSFHVFVGCVDTGICASSAGRAHSGESTNCV